MNVSFEKMEIHWTNIKRCFDDASLLSRWIDDYGNPSFSRKLSRKGCNIDFWISRETCGYRNVICIGIRSTDIDEQFASIRTTESNYTCTRVNRYVLIKIGNDRRDCYFTIWFLLLPFRQFPNPFSHVRPLRDAYQSIGRESFVRPNASGKKFEILYNRSNFLIELEKPRIWFSIWKFWFPYWTHI